LDCPFSTSCPVSRRWERLHSLLRREMEIITFKDLADDTVAAESLLAVNA
jgi:hypothetical protein